MRIQPGNEREQINASTHSCHPCAGHSCAGSANVQACEANRRLICHLLCPSKLR